MTTLRNPGNPLISLQQGHWFKLICGASYQYLSAVHDLALVYTLAGVDCIDVAADPAVVMAVRNGIRVAQERAVELGRWANRPWVMISLNDGEDPHFRKATFDPDRCPGDCPRPCAAICPPQAIAAAGPLGLMRERCYGCGRCLPVCPLGLIEAHRFTLPVEAIASQLLPTVDALEIHTRVGRASAFAQLWQTLSPYVPGLKLVSVSCPDDPGLVAYLQDLYTLMQPRPAALIWQTDGRPMSGDIGDGTTHAAIKLAQKVLSAGLPGYVQLAGGTNGYTVEKLNTLGLLPVTGQPTVAGVAYGSYARGLILAEPTPDLTVRAGLRSALARADGLVAQLKGMRPDCLPRRLAGST